VRSSWLASAASALAITLGPAATTYTGPAEPPSGGVTTDGSGNIVATVPGASIAAGDHVEYTVDRGHSYRAVFLVWVAPNALKATFKVRADGGVVNHCSSVELRSGAVTSIRCQFRPSAKKSSRAGGITITAVVRTRNFGSYSRTYRHQLA
jgi:hypothetical protein